MRQLSFLARVLLFASALAPLIVIPFAPFPFAFGKMIFVRSIAGAVAALAAVYCALEMRRRGWKMPLGWVRNPIVVAVAVFLFSAVVSTALAPNPYRGFFGEIERAEGLYGLVAYFVLFIAMAFFFEARHWRVYFRIGLLIGAFVIAHVVVRYLGFEFLPVTLGTTRQPGSVMGNPGLVASFLILLLAYAAFVYRDSRGFWKYFALGTGLAGVGTIALLAVRGAVLGVIAGALVFAVGLAAGKGVMRLGWGRFALDGRRTARVFVALFLLGGVFFWLTRGNPLWRSVPVLDRAVAFSWQSASVQTRILSLGTSWAAFKERPLFGWGPENYSVAYNKYYNPAYAKYAEEWFDRAHNKLLDVLVMQGVVGLASYLGIFVALLLALSRLKELRDVRLFLGAVTTAYFVQNLFLFDHVNSYVPFFGILSFCASQYARERQEEKTATVPKHGRLFFGGAAVLVPLVAIYSIFAWNAIPLSQTWNLSRAADKTERFLRPYNFVQKDLRSLFMQRVLASAPLADSRLQSLAREALNALEEVARKEPYDPQLIVRLAGAYNQIGKDNLEFLKRGTALIERARALSSKRQTIRGLHALILGGTGKYEEAVQLARETLALEPGSAKSHYYLGIVLAMSVGSSQATDERDAERVSAEAIQELNVALSAAQALAAGGNYMLFSESDFENMMITYQNLSADEELLETSRVAQQFYPSNFDFYKVGIRVARKHRNAAELIRIAERVKALLPQYADDMEVILDLTRKGKWNILDTL